MKPNIFEYTDYRSFLRDYYSYAKKNHKNFSYRRFAKMAGFSSPSFFQYIMNGKRNLTKDYIPGFASAIGLNKSEFQYFETLVSFNQAKNAEAKRYYFELLRGLRKGRIGEPIKDEQFEYFSNWYYPVIRELVTLPDFEEDPEWIRRQLRNKITTSEARQALELLQRIGLLKRDENGRLFQSDAAIATDDLVHYTAVYSFHQQMLSLAKEILAATKGDGNEISGLTMPVSKKQFNDIRKMISEFENKVMRYLVENPDTPEAVSQLNIQFLNITNQTKWKNSND